MTDSLVKCSCCYCGSLQYVPTPPSLHLCSSCHHEFRTYEAASGTRPMELTEAAQKHYLPNSSLDEKIVARASHLAGFKPEKPA